MKHIYTLFFVVATLALQAQRVEQCGIRQYTQQKIEADYNYQLALDRAEMSAQKWIQEHRSELKAPGDKIVIPVVFHIVYHEDSANQNLSEARILQQLEILNRDFNRANRDTNLTRDIFDSIATETPIVFEMAKTDPDGNPSNGITRTATEFTGFDIFPIGGGVTELDNLKITAEGGKDAWDNTKYLNIWVARLTVFGGEGLYGIATFPLNMDPSEGGDPEAEPSFQGVSVHFPTVGINVQVEDTIWSGRTLSHEVGHFLGLRHIWADEQNPFTGGPGNCEQDDFVYDTPMSAQSADFECDLERNFCDNENEFSNGYWGAVNPPDMIENFMDYAREDCQNMFSHGQFERVAGFTNTSRKDLWFENPNGNEPEDFKAWLYTEAANTPCRIDCDGEIMVMLENETGNVSYELDGAVVNGPLITGVCEGIHTVKITNGGGEIKELRTYVGGIYQAPDFTGTSTNASCGSCPDGAASVNVLSGNEPITITWETTPVVNGPELTDVLPGVYYYELTDGCGEVYRDSVEVGFATGLNELSTSDISLFPNPTTGVLNLNLKEGMQVEFMSLFTALGKELRKLSFTTVGNGSYRIELGEIPQGTYFLKCEDALGGSITLPFIKR